MSTPAGFQPLIAQRTVHLLNQNGTCFNYRLRDSQSKLCAPVYSQALLPPIFLQRPWYTTSYRSSHSRRLGPGFGEQNIFNFWGKGRKNVSVSLCVLD